MLHEIIKTKILAFKTIKKCITIEEYYAHKIVFGLGTLSEISRNRAQLNKPRLLKYT